MPTHSYPADALAAVTDPALVDYHPALMQDAWCRLKAARGEPVARYHLLQAQHLIRPAQPAAAGQGPWASVGDAIRPVLDRVPGHVRRLMAARTATPDGGDAA